MQTSDLAAVCLLDREVFGADRSHLLAELFRRAPECAWVVRDDAGLRGYCFGRPGRVHTQLGPVVAFDGAVAQELARASCARLHKPEAYATAIDVALYDREWLEFLKSVGFVVERPFTRMFLRGHKHPGIPERQYAICGPEFA